MTNEIKRVTLKEMLRWAYNRQQVDSLTGKTLDAAKDELLPFVPLRSSDGAAAILARSKLGAAIDCSGSNRFARNEVHPDAEALHDAVLSLGAIDARLVVEFGHTGRFPEPTAAIARPRPFIQAIESGGGGTTARQRERPARAHANGSALAVGQIESWAVEGEAPAPRPRDRCGRGVFQGEVTFFSVAVAETIRERVPIFVGAGRGKMKLSHYEETVTEVEYCPIDWWPDLAWVQAVNGIAEHWERVLAKLRHELAPVEFRNHVIADLCELAS